MAGLTYDPIPSESLEAYLTTVPDWDVVDGELVREWTFSSYASGVLFAVGAAQIAEALNHHPNLFIGYGKVKVSLTTHDASSLTAFDFEFARRLDQVQTKQV